MIPGNANPLLLATAAADGAVADVVTKSLRFNSGDSAYLNRTPSAAGNRKTWTWSGWVKRCSTGSYQAFFSSYQDSTNFHHFRFRNDEKFETRLQVSGSDKLQLITDQVFRDFSAWYHVVFAYDSTQSTASNRAKLYINGSQVTDFSTETYPSQNDDSYVANTTAHYIGQRGDNNLFHDGYLADCYLIDGSALDPTSFGAFDDSGVWQAQAFAGSYEGGITVSNATGALPIYNTTGDFGGVKGSGTRSDSSSSTIELAVAMDGTGGGTTFTDEHATIKGSGSAVALTANGNVQTVTSVSKFYGSSASFDGSGDYLSFTNIDLQRSSFTYEAWVYGTDTGRTLPTVIFTAGFSGGVIHSFGLANSSGDIDAVFGASTRPSSGNYYTQAPAISINKWNHIAWVRNGTTISIYVNGVGQTLDTTQGGNTGRDEVNNVEYIGSNAANEDFSGYIQDARVYSSAKYTADFTVPGVSSSFRLDFSDNSSNAALGTDSSGNDNDFTVNNLVAAAVNYNSTLTAIDTSETITNPENAFDNDTSTTIGGIFGGIKFTPPGGSQSNVTSLRFYSQSFGQGGTIKLNGSTIESNYDFGSGGWYAFSSSALSNISNTLTSFEWDRQPGSGSNNNDYLFGVEINGTVLVNSDPSNTDSLFDAPTNGSQSDTGAGGEVSGCYATLNPLVNSSYASLSDGNLKLTTPSTGRGTSFSTIAVSSGKFYCEIEFDTGSGASARIGVIRSDTDYAETASFTGETNAIGYLSASGEIVEAGVTLSTQSTYSTGDIIGMALNMDDGEIEFFKNGVSQGTYNRSILDSGSYYFAVADSSNSAGATFIANFGQRPFAYTAPSGYKALCTTNLPTPTIADGSDYFEAKLYTGNGTSQTITGLEFSPDLLWIKERSSTSTHFVFDTIRGAGKYLRPAESSLEAELSELHSAFTSDGFTVGNSAGSNESSQTYVAWAWDAGANSNKTYTVKVVSDSGNKYRFDDFGTSAVTLDLEEGSTYVFDQSDSSNSGHPLRFSTTSDGTHNSGSEYTTGVTTTGTPGSAGAKTTIVVAASAPTLYYYCSSHSGMGGQANTNSTAGASNFDGSIQSTVRANASAGFSIIEATISGSGTIGHGLNTKPHIVFRKRIDADSDWYVAVDTGSVEGYLILNDTAAITSESQGLTNSVFTAAWLGNSNEEWIGYAFSPVEGFSAFGTYEGNGSSSDGTFVYTGFKIRWLMIKAADSTGASSNFNSWLILDTTRDPYNASNNTLWANRSSQEDLRGNGSTAVGSLVDIDILSNGFKLRQGNDETNGIGITHIYAAFAENPFSSNGGLAR